jgi:small-conductance mechanosensitive channel
MVLKPATLIPVLVVVWATFARPVSAQARLPPEPDQIAAAVASAAKTATLSEPPATLVYTNRQITTVRATILGRTPSMRVAAASKLLDSLLTGPSSGQVTTQAFPDGVLIRVDGHPALVLVAADLDRLAGDRLDTEAATAAQRLRLAIAEAIELRTPRVLLKAALLVLAGTVLYLVLIWLLVRVKRQLSVRVQRAAEHQLRRVPGAQVIATLAQGRAYADRVVTLVFAVLSLLLTYQWLVFALRQLPYTRPLGESLRSRLVQLAIAAGEAFVDQLPNISTVLVILVITRYLVRLVVIAFDAVERGRVTIPWIYPETAQPTRRIAVALLWIFALIVSYPYLPGSDSEVFKGASVFVGIIVSLGSAGIMNQIMSGLMVTYSRAVRRGDFVRISDFEGVVTHLGALSTKLTTHQNEEISIPNVVVASHATTNYSRNAQTAGVMVPTSVTIGYGVPWRQVEALLLLAAERTSGLRSEPKPLVLQTLLEDAAVKYTLLVCLDQPERRTRLLDQLHAHIQDAFNEYGVQIMSPRYEGDPDEPKVVPPSRWYAAPAAPDPKAAKQSAADKRGRGSLGTV